MKNSKYPEGYLNKIEYWNLQLNIGINTRDFKMAAKASEKLVYFTNKHQDLIDNGEMVPGQTGEMVG